MTCSVIVELLKFQHVVKSWKSVLCPAKLRFFVMVIVNDEIFISFFVLPIWTELYVDIRVIANLLYLILRIVYQRWWHRRIPPQLIIIIIPTRRWLSWLLRTSCLLLQDLVIYRSEYCAQFSFSICWWWAFGCSGIFSNWILAISSFIDGCGEFDACGVWGGQG